jgi:hypothetical protein
MAGAQAQADATYALDARAGCRWLASFSRGAFRAREAVGLVPFEGLFED